MNLELSFGALHGDLSQNFQGFSSWSFIDLAVSFTSVFEQNTASPCCVVLVLSPIHSLFLLTHFPCWETCGHYAAVTSFQTHARKQKVAAVIADTSLNTVADNLKYSFNLQLCFLFCYCTFQAAVMMIFPHPNKRDLTLITVLMARSAIISLAWAWPPWVHNHIQVRLAPLHGLLGNPWSTSLRSGSNRGRDGYPQINLSQSFNYLCCIWFAFHLHVCKWPRKTSIKSPLILRKNKESEKGKTLFPPSFLFSEGNQ